MPVPIQQGGVADRLRNFLRLTGRAATTMDEVVTPVVNVQNLDRMPWRTKERRFMIEMSHGALAASFSAVGLRVPLDQKGVAVVDQLIFTSSTTQTYRIGITVDPQGFPHLGENPVFDVENWSAFGDATVTAQLPPIAWGNDSPATMLSWVLTTIKVTANTTLIVPVEIAIRGPLAAEPTSTRCLGIENTTLNTAVDVTMCGVWYPDAI